MTFLYCDCFSGISGDMFLGALLDAGLPKAHLSEQFTKINLPEFHSVRAEKVHKGALVATQLVLEFQDHHEEHHHEGHEEHHHHDEYRQHGHHHRHFSDIKALIESSSLSSTVKETSLLIFRKLAEAESQVHGVTVEEVHFHEVGAVDSILDIVGAAVGLEYFNVQSVYSSALPLGTGQVNTQHGLLPLPAPATLNLLQMAHAPTYPSRATTELITPTGAAILAALAQFRQPEMNIDRIGIGAGRRDLEWANILRLVFGTHDDRYGSHLVIETNIDDMNPQVYGHVMEKLFHAGALDVYFTPIYMKKNRPGTKLSVIVHQEDETVISDLILRETSTLGVRVKPVQRHEAKREILTVETRYGQVAVKVKILGGKRVQATPEYDNCVRLAKEAGVPLNRVLQEAIAEGKKILGDS